MGLINKYIVHIEVCEDDEYIIAHDEYEANSEAEALADANEDYPGSNIHTKCGCGKGLIRKDLQHLL